jgi:hypothetical protein
MLHEAPVSRGAAGRAEVIHRWPDIDVVHYYDEDTGRSLCSRHRRFWLETRTGSRLWRGSFPARLPDAPLSPRFARRFLRTDQCVLHPLAEGYFACRGGRIYWFDERRARLHLQGRLRQCRSPLSVEQTREGGLVFGEYGANRAGASIPIWMCGPTGRDWRIVLELPAGRARHVHGIYRDPYDDAYFITTGDFEGQNWLIRVDGKWRHMEYWGDGSQQWRAVSLFFTADHIAWITDSHLETNYVSLCPRNSRTLERLTPAPSPAWFGKTLRDGTFVVGCAWEKGPGCQAEGATLLTSDDGATWREVGFWAKDSWPAPWFKNGVVRFAAGPQSRDDFVLFGEGLRGLDGERLHCRL